jgi:uncharacterized phage infection (PIP) family protein YhgE
MEFKISGVPHGSTAVDNLMESINAYNKRLNKLYEMKEFSDGVLKDYYHYIEFFNMSASKMVQLTIVLKQVLRQRREIYNEIASIRTYQNVFSEATKKPATRKLFDNGAAEEEYDKALEERVDSLVYKPKVGDVDMLLSLKNCNLEEMYDYLMKEV